MDIKNVGYSQDELRYPIYLDEQSIHERWESSDRKLSSVIADMEKCEDWAFEFDESNSAKFKSLCYQLEFVVSRITLRDIEVPLIRLMAYCKSGRFFHICEALEKRFSGSVIRMLQTAAKRDEESDFIDSHKQLMLDRYYTLKRFSLLTRVFSQTRLRFVYKILKEVHGNASN